MTRTIIALDPGGTTGWAVWQGDQINVGHWGPDDHHLTLFDNLGFYQTSEYHIVCESFEYRQHARANVNLVSKEYIGIVKLFQQERMSKLPNQYVKFQTAAQAKGFVTDSKIKASHLWTPGMRHAMDAMRHLIYYDIFALGNKSWLDQWK